MSTTQKALEALRASALAVFDGPECPQIARDVIEWFYSTLSVQAQAAQAVPAEPHLFELWWERYMPQATQSEAWEAWQAAPRADGVGVAIPQPVAVPQPLTEEQFKVEWHRRTGRICGTDLGLLLQAKYVTELAHGIGAAAPEEQA